MEHENFIMLTYKPNFPIYNWTMNEQLDVYTNNMERTQRLPSPSPTDEPINFRLSEPDINTALHSINPTGTMKVNDVVSQLTDPFSSGMCDGDKVRLLYHWLASQDLKKGFAMTTNFATVDYQLRKLQNKESSYAAMFLLLCDLADIPCVIIRGQVKVSPNKTNQAEWNAVLVDGHWHLVDTFWGAHLTDTLIPIAYYLFPDPKQFIYSHWAESLKWQLLDRPIGKRAFENQEYLTENFFHMNMSVLRPRATSLEATDGELDLTFALKDAGTLQQEFQVITACSAENHRQPDFVYKQPASREGQDSVILRTLVRFEEKGKHLVQIIGNTSTDDRRQYDWVAIYDVNVMTPCTKGPFPSIGKSGWGPGWYLEKCGLKPRSHPYAVITCNTLEIQIEFEVKAGINLEDVKLKYKLVEFKCEHHENSLVQEGKSSRDGIAVFIRINVAGSLNSRLTISATVAGQVWEDVCVYYVDTAAIMESDAYREVLADLRSAYKSRKIDTLKLALDKAKDYKKHRKVAKQFKDTKDLYDMLHDYERSLQQIKTIDSNTILTLKTFKNPDESITRVMRATFIVLGTDPRKLVSWDEIKMEITNLGQKSVQRRINDLDVHKLDGSKVKAARREIPAELNAVASMDISFEVAPFAKWLESVLQTYSILNGQVERQDNSIDNENEDFDDEQESWYIL